MTWVFDDKLPIYLQIIQILKADIARGKYQTCLLYTSPSPRDMRRTRMPSCA